MVLNFERLNYIFDFSLYVQSCKGEEEAGPSGVRLSGASVLGGAQTSGESHVKTQTDPEVQPQPQQTTLRRSSKQGPPQTSQDESLSLPVKPH